MARRYLDELMFKYEGRVAEAAAHAGVERESFYRLLRRFAIELERPRNRACAATPWGDRAAQLQKRGR